MIRTIIKLGFVIFAGSLVFGGIEALGQEHGASSDLKSLYQSNGVPLQKDNFDIPFSNSAKTNASKQADGLPDLISKQRMSRYLKGPTVDKLCVENRSCIKDEVELEMTIQGGKESTNILKFNNGQLKITQAKGDLEDDFNSEGLRMTGLYLSSPTIPFNGGGPLIDRGNETITFADQRQMVARKLEFDTGKAPYITLESCDGSPERKIPGHGFAWFDPKSAQLVKLSVEGYGDALTSKTPNEPNTQEGILGAKCPPVHYFKQEFEYKETTLGDSGSALWLPMFSVVWSGPSNDFYFTNITAYVSYSHFDSTLNVMDSDKMVDDSPEKTAKPTAPDPFKSNKK